MFNDFRWDLIESILKEVQVGLTLVASNGDILYFNRLAAELLGWDMEHEEDNSVLSCHLPNTHELVLNKIRNSTVKEWHRIILNNNRYIENIYSPINIPDKFTGIVIITRDVTEREEMISKVKNIAAELQRNNEILKLEIAQRKEAEELLRRLSSLDGLTDIPNRRYFDEYLEREWQRAERNSSPLSLIMTDIDYFKAYNDTYGHQGGDDCLKKVAIALKNTLKRPGDFVGRYGGEEFAVILPETDTEGALVVAEALRKSVESLNIEHVNSSISKYVTISLGVAIIIPTTGTTPAILVNFADQALYDAKQQGRNRVSLKA
jgi:diguanylate cyclase (GGDEF)-like protein/PAS domain S-box-containing protein